MASDFLKRKAREQAESVTERFGEDAYGGTKWRNKHSSTKESEDGAAPSSGKSKTVQSKKASGFLTKKAQEQAASVTERFGEDAYGGTKWREENKTVPAETLSGLLQRVRSLGNSDAGKDTRKTAGGFYSRPAAEGASEVYNQVSRLMPALREYAIPVEDAAAELQQAQKKLKIIESYLGRAKDAYTSAPSEKNAGVYNQIATAYEQAYQVYSGAYTAYTDAFGKYKTAEDRVSQILVAYQQYADGQRAAYDSWRGTIREEGAIKRELDDLDTQISKMQVRSDLGALNQVMNAATMGSYGLPAAGMQSGGAEAARLQELKEMRALLQEEYDWSRYFKYAELMGAADFTDKSGYVSTANGMEPVLNKLSGIYSETGFDDLTYDYINRNEEARGKAMVNSVGDNSALLGLDKSYLEKMTDEEISIFNYLYATQGADAAYEYTAYLTADLNRRQRAEQEAKWAAWAKDAPVRSSVFSTLISPMKGLSFIGQFADLTADGEIDQNAGYNKFSGIPGTIRGEVAKQIEDSGKWGNVGSFAYQTGMSMADFLFNTAITGGNQAVTLAIMGTGAAADTTVAAKDRGLSDVQAFMLGGVAGLAEVIMEKVSLEALLDPNLLRNGSLEYIVKNMVAEGSEEVGTDVINLLADTLIARDQSEWQQSIDAYVRAGKSREEAFGLAVADQILAMGADFLGGAISGGIMAGSAAAAFGDRTGKLGQQLKELDLGDEDVRAFIETGLESDPDSDAYYIASEMQKKLDAGEKLSAHDLSLIYQANIQAVAEEQAREDDQNGEGLSLPEPESDTEMPGSVTADQGNVTLNQGDVTNAPEDGSLSVAERLRREQSVNGGTVYENEEQGLQLGAAFPERSAGAGLSDGGIQRNDGTGTREQAGKLAGGAERRGAWADTSRATVARQNYARSLRLEKVSSLDLGLQNGTEARNIQVMPQEHWDAEMSQLADRIYNETGKGVTYVLGRIQIRGTGGTVGYARGVITGDRIIVQADHLRLPMEQIADHEAYHAKVDFAAEGRMDLNAQIKRHILDTFSPEQFRQVLDKYIVGLRGVIDVNEAKTAEEFESAVRQIEEEIFADAYAGINAFGAGADRFTSAVNERMDQLYVGKIRNQDNGTEEPTGPPAERFSLDKDIATTFEGRSLTDDPEVYSYDFLISQPPMKPVELPPVTEVRDANGKVDSAGAVANGIKNALSVGTERGGRVYVKNQYTGRELWVTTSAIRHGLNGAANRIITNARLGNVIGEVVQNAIPINALHNTADGIEGTYAMAGYAYDKQGREFVAIVTVEQRTDAVAGIDLYDVTHAVSGRQKRSKQADTKSQGVNPSMLASERGSQADTKSQGVNLIKASSGVSIADILEAVNEVYQSILSEDVLAHLGETRNPKGHYSGRVRYSYAGENAATADLEALARAKEMRSAGVADETIRQQTGWHMGMDGKWRWEIDDSTMRYDSSGDIRGAESAKWAMEDYESARDDLWGSADLETLNRVRAYNRADVAGDEAAKRELYDELAGGQYAYYFVQYVEAMARAKGARNAPAGGTLQDYIDHPALFEAYPQLRNVTLRFERMGGGNMGYFNRLDNEIVLNEDLRYAAEDTLVHEIQHVIQKAEGFARGSNEEYWRRRQDSDDAVKVYDARIRESEKKVDEIMGQLPENVAEQFRRWSAMDDSTPEAMALLDELSDGPYGDLFEDYYMLTWGLNDMQRTNYKRGPRDLYRNTAGEIEARDSAARRSLTPEQRRDQAPVRADDYTVFVDEDAIAEMDAEYGPQLQSAAEFDQDTIDSNIQQVAQMEPVTGISGQEFAKGEVDLITQVETFFNRKRNRVYSPELGEVILDRKGVKSDIAHGIGRKKAAAFAAVPDVIEHGLVVDYRKNWKGRGYDTAVVAAPITIGDQTHAAAVILLRSNQTNRFYVHEVLAMENGAMPFKTGTREGYPGGDAPSILSILKRILAVKNQNGSTERFSVEDTRSYAEILERQQELRQRELNLQERKRAATNSPELLQAMDEYSSLFTEMRGLLPKRRNGTATQAELDRIEEIKTLRDEYMHRIADLQESLGLAAISQEESEIREEKEALRVASDAAWAREGAERENLAIAKAGVSPSEYFRKKAIKAFETTSNFNEAGYLLPDGKLLNFSGGERNHRYRDHREIGEIYEATNGVAALNRFLADGNIRIMAESPGVDLPAGVEPTREQYAALRKFINSNGVQDGRFYVDFSNTDGSRAGNYAYEGRIYADRVINDIKHYYETGETVQRVDLNQFRYSVDDEGSRQRQEQKSAAPGKKFRPVAESLPLIAKKDLRNTVLNLFSIPNGQRAELGTLIDAYADRLIKNGSLTEDDRKAFFDRMYDTGVMVMPADEYSAFARSHIAEGRIYVSGHVKADFGDDWADFRRRAFGAGVYLVNDRSAPGIDQWNTTLSAEDMLPGLFDSEETDERTILERIVQVAEEGKDEHLSLAEYTRRLSRQEGISEDEFLDNMERQLDWALRTFAEKARLEVHLRDRTGRKIAQEREKGAERMTRQQAREAQRRADERQARKDSARRAKERRELRELQQRTLKQLQWLSKNRFRAPEELQGTWDEVLGDIDLYAISAADEMRWSDKHNATWKDLAQMYKDAMKNDPNFLPSKELERIVTRLDATKIADMDLGALQDLYKAAIGLRTEFYNRNNVINDEMQRLFAEVYTDAKREIESAPGGFTGGVADKFLNLDQLTPMNVLQRMAGWDPDGSFYSMAKQLERGERDVRAYRVKAQKMLQDFLTEHEGWVKKADGQGRDAIWYEVEVPQLLELGMGDKPIFGPTVKVYMTPAQKVHMYLESKNLDNLRHMTGGRTFVNKELYSQGKRQEALSQGRTIRLAPETVRKLVSDLTPEEMELARVLDRYYNTFATQEINRVSNILYGYDKAMGKNYAPIYTNRNYTKTEFGVFDTTAEGVGNMKGRQYAVNPSYNISAFDAFERHVDQIARFCGMAIPARNWTTLMNWREKNNSTGDVITHKWGEESKKYIENLITTLQAGDDSKSDTISSGAAKLQSNYISAVFGANPSIVLKQLGSIPLAGAYLDAENMPTPAQIGKIDRSLIAKYTQELEWRTMGYATPETKQLKDNPNWTQTNKAFKFAFGGGAITAMDGWAASTLWPWAENKVRREHPELAVGTKAQIDAGESAFYKKVAEEFEIAVSRSQSVSDEIHQSTLRKSRSPVTRAFTMFRSDSAQTYNALRQKIGEARYYMRTGAKEKVIKTAKKAAGTAFVALLLNAVWSEAISFLMALWKNKGKYYRDDEDELTFQGVAGEMVSNMLGSFAGVVTFGEEVFDIIGNILTGEKIYDIETPGMEQLNDLIDAVTTAGGGMRDLVAGGWDVLKNGGNLGEYFAKHSGEMLGGIKELAEAAVVYLTGLPASNLEAYLVGAMKWISPELGAAYDDLFQSIDKSDLAGMAGAALEGRVGRILSDRNISESDDTAATLAALYEDGYKTAIPGDTPTSVSIDGEKRSLGEYQQQAYDTIWGGIVADALDNMVASDSFKEADAKTQAKMLSNLYNYAAERAKTELFDGYEMDSGTAKNAAIVAAGATVAECIAWNTITSEMKSGEKSAELASWDLPENVKREIFRNKISDSREDGIAAFRETGLSFDQFLQAYSAYGQINNEDLKAGMKAVEFSHWVNAQGYTTEQAAVVKDELTYFNMTPASSSRYDELVESGMDPDDAYDLTGILSGLVPGEGEDTVVDLQKWRASVDFSDDVEDQLTALSAVMTDAQFQKVEIANNFGVSPDAYVTLQEIKPQYDADGNGSYKNAEIQAAVDALPGHFTTEQKAVLWQLATGSTSAKNNPYSRQVGQRVLDARAAAKEAAAEAEEPEGLKLGSW